jgi:SAM-dependent methyltransferase
LAESERDRWDRRYRDEGAPEEPSAFLISLDFLLPRDGSALDLAGGGGRNALWLARRGLEVTLADVSEAGLTIARDRAAKAGLSIQAIRLDLEREPLPAGPWGLVVCFHFLWRPLFAVIPDVLGPGGLFVYAQPTRKNLERHARPGPAFLLEEGELPRLIHGLTVIRYEEGWFEEGRHEARLVARKG